MNNVLEDVIQELERVATEYWTATEPKKERKEVRDLDSVIGHSIELPQPYIPRESPVPSYENVPILPSIMIPLVPMEFEPLPKGLLGYTLVGTGHIGINERLKYSVLRFEVMDHENRHLKNPHFSEYAVRTISNFASGTPEIIRDPYAKLVRYY